MGVVKSFTGARVYGKDKPITTDPKEKADFAMIEIPDNIAIRLDNDTCVYCGIELSQVASTKEHVIARNFVPRGKLEGCWNLIVKACTSCNLRKSDLEDDISAISMLPDVYGEYGHDDESAAVEAARKAQRSYSRYTKKAVKDSHEKQTFVMPFGQEATFSFKFIGPPHIETSRLFSLAHFQLVGFFYWITFDKRSRRGRFWPGGFYPLVPALRTDWGNPVHRAFMDVVAQWEPRLIGTTADGFYKVAVRRNPDSDCWSWALEWNKNLRLVGFFGDKGIARNIASKFPKLEFRTVAEGIRVRTEIPLIETVDRLFS